MGWTYQYEKPADPKAYLNSKLTWSSDTGSRRVLASALVRQKVFYAAVEHIKPDGSRDVWAAVFLVDMKQSRDGLRFGYKEMTEHMGPCESECPAAILKLLTPLPETEQYALAWRERCHAALKRKTQNKLQDGATVTFGSAYSLPAGPCATFKARKRGRSWVFFSPEGHGPYRLQGYASNILEVAA